MRRSFTIRGRALIVAALLAVAPGLAIVEDGEPAGAQPGTGIGLALARELTELHGGSLTVDSDEGFGSTFTMVLREGRAHLSPEQIVDDSAIWMPTSPAQVLPSTEDVPAGGEEPDDEDVTTVLVIDDNVDATRALKRLLRVMGYSVTIAQDGQSGIDLARQLHPDVILLDIGLPHMDGYTVARHLRSLPEFATTRIIALTGYGQDASERVRAAGMDQHLVKPVDADELQAAICAVV